MLAQIREELILVDKFTEAFTSYLKNTGRAAQATELTKKNIQDLGNQQKITASSTDALASKIKSLVRSYVGIKGISSLFYLSDTMAQTTARLDRMNDGLQTTSELNQMIYESAQRSRGAYQDTADMVAKLGTLAKDAFSSSAEVVAFAEQINKQMTLSGASTVGAQAAMLQLTQAMSSGVLRGEELNSILEQTPTIAQTIADYIGVSTGKMREMASEGQITAEVVKNAMFSAAEETNAAFEKMPMTWAQVWTKFQNVAIRAVQPVLTAINWLANNLDVIGPIVLGVASAFAIFLIAANWIKICTSATNALASAQKMLAAVTAAGWAIPLIAIVLVITAIYGLVAIYNKVTGSTVSATGIIAGAFFTLAAFVLNNSIVPLQRGFATFVNFIGNVFNDPITAIKVAFYDLALTVLGYIRSMAGGIESLINAIPGVEVNLTSGIDSLYSTLEKNREAAIEAGSYKEFIKPMEYFDLSESFKSGYSWGSNLFSGLSDFFGGSSSGSSSAISGSIPAFNDISGKLSDISGSVDNIEKSVDMSKEDLQALVDVAERKYVNQINLTAQTPVINVSGQNTGNTAEDRKNLADAIRDILIEQVASGSTRSTARAY